ncbi:MAG: signal peptidase II [Bacteroidetes bacterium]|nr:signal peptidase II [Bacteroidota bacterium]
MRILFVTLAVLLADQASKLIVKGISLPGLGIVVEGMSYGQSIPVIGDWFKITYIENPNMAFGLDIGGKLFLVVFSFLASIGLLIYLYRQRKAPVLLRLSLALILAGALGNLVDRTFYGVWYGQAPLFYGNVVDFVDLDLFTINFGGSSFKFWPIWNVADAAVSVGVVMLLIIGIPHTEEAASKTQAGLPDARRPDDPPDSTGTSVRNKQAGSNAGPEHTAGDPHV